MMLPMQAPAEERRESGAYMITMPFGNVPNQIIPETIIFLDCPPVLLVIKLRPRTNEH